MNDTASAPAGPSALQKTVVAVLAAVFLLHPYLLGGAFDSSSRSKGNELVGDGLELVTRHPALTELQDSASLSALLATFTSPWWGGLERKPELYRPVPLFVLGVTGMVAETYDPAEPGWTPFPYHFIAVALKVLCSLLVLEVAWLVLRNGRMALVAGALFATLPVHGQVVFDVAGVAELCATAFGLAAWAAWLRAGDRPLANPAKLGSCLLLLLFATLSRETAFVLPLVFFLADVGMNRAGGFGKGVGHALAKLPALAACLAVLLGSLALRFVVLGKAAVAPDLSGGEAALANPLLLEGVVTRVMNALRVMAAGVGSIFGVNTLSSNGDYSADYAASQIPVLGPFSVWNLVGLLVVVGLVGGAVALYQRCRTRSSLVLALFGALLLTSNLLVPIGAIHSETFLFFPSVLAVLFAGAWLGRWGAAGTAAGLALALGGGVWTYLRADTWSTSSGLWEYTADHSSTQSARAKLQNGIYLAEEQYLTMSEDEFEKAIELHPRYAEAYGRLGQSKLAAQVDDPEGAVHAFEQALSILLEDRDYDYPPEPVVTADSIGPRTLLLFLTQLRRTREEVRDPAGHLAWMDDLVAKGYESPHVHLRRGEVLLDLGLEEDAARAFERAYDVGRRTGVVTTDLVLAYGNLLNRQQRFDEALTLYESVDAFAQPRERVLVDIARAEASLYRADGAGLAACLQILEELWNEFRMTATDEDRAFANEDVFHVQYLMAQAKMAKYGAEPTRDQMIEVEGHLKQALAFWNTANPETFSATETLAQLEQQLGKLDEARPLLEQLVQVQGRPPLRMQLASIYAMQGEYEDALDQFSRVDVAMTPALLASTDDLGPWQLLLTVRSSMLQIYDRMGRSDEALVKIEEWHERAAGEYDENALVTHSTWLLGKGDLAGALAQGDLLLEYFGDSPLTQEHIETLREVQVLEQRTASGEASVEEYEQLATIRLRVQDRSGAIEMARKAVELSEELPVGDQIRRLDLLITALTMEGNIQEAVGAARQTLELDLEPQERAEIESMIAQLEEML